MDEFTQKQDGSGLFTLSFSPKLYRSSLDNAPISALRRVIKPVDNTHPAQVDSMRLLLCFRNLKLKDIEFYFYILGKLERNDRPVHINIRDAAKYCGEKFHSEVSKGLNRLTKEGLLFKLPRRQSQYIVNPMYAWKGDRMNYIDASALEVFNELDSEV